MGTLGKQGTVLRAKTREETTQAEQVSRLPDASDWQSISSLVLLAI
jgi:hypothetical protein